MSEGEEDDIELQRALALSLQQHDPPSNVIAVEEETTQQQQQQKQRPPPPVATKNLPAFDPTDREISDCFQELSRHRTTFTASDLVHVRFFIHTHAFHTLHYMYSTTSYSMHRLDPSLALN